MIASLGSIAIAVIAAALGTLAVFKAIVWALELQCKLPRVLVDKPIAPEFFGCSCMKSGPVCEGCMNRLRYFFPEYLFSVEMVDDFDSKYRDGRRLYVGLNTSRYIVVEFKTDSLTWVRVDQRDFTLGPCCWIGVWIATKDLMAAAEHGCNRIVVTSYKE